MFNYLVGPNPIDDYFHFTSCHSSDSFVILDKTDQVQKPFRLLWYPAVKHTPITYRISDRTNVL